MVLFSQVTNLRLTLTVIAFFTFICHGIFPDCKNGPLSNHLVCDASAPSIDRAKALAAELTVVELIQNMINVSPGVPRLGLPPYNWWSEALHGVASGNGVTFASPGQEFSSATSFPAPITLGAAFDDELIHAIATVISTEARAFSNFNRSGLDFFTPNVNPFRDPRWGRGQETPGEDPFHVAQYAFQYVTGLQGGVPSPGKYLKTIADCKHWAAYDIETTPEGIDRHRFNALVTQQDLAEYYSPPFQSCVRDAKVASVMCSYNEVNGVPSCADSFILQDLVRDFWGLGEDQWIVSDCGAIDDISDRHHYTDTKVNATAVALRAGTDIECGHAYANNLQAALNQSLVSEDDLRRSLIRQFNSMIRLGYFDPPEQQPYRQLTWTDVNTPEAQQLAYQGAVEGIVLLKNDGILPLNSSAEKIAVIGPWANATTQLQSNYNGIAPFLISPFAAFQSAGFDVAFAQGTIINTTSTVNFSAALTAASGADVVFYLGGLDNRVESEGHDRFDIAWPGNQLELVNQLADLGKPLVVLQMGGGQVDSSSLKNDSRINALIWGGYPGQSGGTALVDIITGKQAPAGRLPSTQYPAEYVKQVPSTDMTLRPSFSNPGRTYKWYTSEPVFEFGFGQHYTTFDFTWEGSGPQGYDIQGLVGAAKERYAHVDLAILDSFNVSVTNTGNVTSDYVALLFARTSAGPSPAPMKELVAYARVKSIPPRGSRTAELKVTLGAIARTDEEGNLTLYPGSYEVLLDTDGVIMKTFVLKGSEERLLTWPGPSI
ncbi:glycoside hydrolase family 3 protein [Marasmius fiardii PR-910]|nr:glycoside hydrolase family 3 protein [Marasmius fiardii PR-910]